MGEQKKVHIVGIEGAGTSALAQIYGNMGYIVSGSDNGDHFYRQVLEGKGIETFDDFKKENVPADIDFAVHSTAFKDNNPEIEEIKSRGIDLLAYPEALGELFKQKVGIAVCGTHGKTTTTAMLAQALENAEVSPTALVGSRVIGWDTNVLLGGGEYFAIEADEYQDKLRFYEPWSVILTSVDWDHPDFYPDFASYKDAFKRFVKKITVTGHLVVWGDSSDTLEVAKHAGGKVLTYGYGLDNQYRIGEQRLVNSGNETIQEFELFCGQESLGLFETPLAGRHNVLNTTAVIALCHAMNLDLAKVREALEKFQGTARRFQQVGMLGNAILIDDYAHHPDEIKATLGGARERFGEKTIWTVFHPHTFTRTKALLQEFAQSFDEADRVVVIDIYGSAREQQGGVSSEDLVKLINKYTYGKAEYVSTIDEATEYLKEKSGQFDVLITMGAGDVWRVGEKLKA
ncbi:MAG TPA: UDP-N-acetylmuramate--L-alanine ligase [Patescibacteria group bacterium]